MNSSLDKNAVIKDKSVLRKELDLHSKVKKEILDSAKHSCIDLLALNARTVTKSYCFRDFRDVPYKNTF